MVLAFWSFVFLSFGFVSDFGIWISNLINVHLKAGFFRLTD